MAPAADGTGWPRELAEQVRPDPRGEVAPPQFQRPEPLSPSKAAVFTDPVSDTHARHHIGCLTIHGQLTEGEQCYVANYVDSCVRSYPDKWEVSARDELTTTIRFHFPDFDVAVCMANDGSEACLVRPVRTVKFDPPIRDAIVNVFHAWRHTHGSPESRAIMEQMELARMMANPFGAYTS